MAKVTRKTPKPTAPGHKMYEFILKQLTPIVLRMKIYRNKYLLSLLIIDPMSVFFIT